MSFFGQPLKPSQASAKQGVTTSYLAKLRRGGHLKEAVHYRWIAPNTYRYLSDALEHFFAHRSEPEIHNRWIEEQLKELNKRKF